MSTWEEPAVVGLPTAIAPSQLPGPYVLWPTIVRAEESARDGARRGLSCVVIPEPPPGAPTSRAPIGKTLEVAHYVNPVRADWPSIAAQKLYVWARFVDDRATLIAGALFRHPRTGSGGALENHYLWESEQTGRFGPTNRGHRLSTALYAHLVRFGYQVTPSLNLTGGDAIWDRLHPNFFDEEDEGLLETVQAVFDDQTRDAIAARYAPDSSRENFDLLKPLAYDAWGLNSYSADT